MTRFLFSLIPQNLLSTIVGYVAHLRRPKLLAKCLRNGFQRRYNISLESAEHSLDYYPSMGALFMRRLRKGVRPIDEDSAYVHPCDSAIGAYGSFKKDLLLQVKGKTYFAESLLGDRDFLAKDWENCFTEGQFVTYYLCPQDYHRVHFPVTGYIRGVSHIPGRLWPVNPWGLEHVSHLFSVNERLITFLETDYGKLVVVMVGATNVGKMNVTFESSALTNARLFRKRQQWPYKILKPCTKGLEMGCFHMGSTVIVVAEKDFSLDITAGLTHGQRVLVNTGGSSVKRDVKEELTLQDHNA